MIKIGQILTFDNEEWIVCFTTTYKDKFYINVAKYNEDSNEYKAYEVERNDERQEIIFKIVKDEELLKELGTLWISEVFVEEN